MDVRNGYPEDRLKLPRLRVVKVGTLCLEPSEWPGPTLFKLKQELGVGGGSTVTLIKSDRVVLVDTGFDFEGYNSETNLRHNAEALALGLRACGLTPEMVDAVFITHWHRDHFGNLELFPRAERLVSTPLAEKLGRQDFKSVDDGEYIAEGVKVIYTPGHTDHHASVLVSSRLAGLKAWIAVAGDAVISYSYFVRDKIWNYNADFYNYRQALESQRRLADLSDVIIPGHGVPFLTSSRAKRL